MSRIAWSKFEPAVLPLVHLCPRPIVRKAIRDSAIEFCERSYVWKDTQEYPIGTDAEYELQRDSISAVHRIDEASIENGPDLEIITPERASELYPRWRTDTSGGNPAVITQTSPTAFILIPTPNTDGVLTLSVSLKPTKTAQYTESILFDEYEEAIAAGALARLKSMPGKPWSGQEAASYAAVFNDRIASANLRTAKGFGRAPLRVRAQFM